MRDPDFYELPSVDPATGVIMGFEETARTLGDLADLFAEPSAALAQASRLLYSTYSSPLPNDNSPPTLICGTTVLQPGCVGDEYFMTRGHFHLDPTRGEVCLCLRGEGILLLMDQDRKTNTQPMSPGSIHLISGNLAHRVVNTDQEPLIFYCAWMSDCGHDYLSIQRDGFGLRVFRSNGCPELRAA